MKSESFENQHTVVWKDKLDLRIVQGVLLGPWSKVPIGQLEFIEDVLSKN